MMLTVSESIPEVRMILRQLARGMWAVAVLCFLLSPDAGAAAQPKPAQPKPAQPKLPADHAAQMAKGLALFKRHVKPILTDKCIRCHGGRDTIEGGLDLTDRDTLV